MTVDPGAAQLLRDDLADLTGLSERPMFGGLAFMRDGHMLAGVMSNGALIYRVGKAREAAVCEHPQVAPMRHSGRRMGGFVMLTDDGVGDDDLRVELLAQALENAAGLPPKE